MKTQGARLYNLHYLIIYLSVYLHTPIRIHTRNRKSEEKNEKEDFASGTYMIPSPLFSTCTDLSTTTLIHWMERCNTRETVLSPRKPNK